GAIRIEVGGEVGQHRVVGGVQALHHGQQRREGAAGPQGPLENPRQELGDLLLLHVSGTTSMLWSPETKSHVSGRVTMSCGVGLPIRVYVGLLSLPLSWLRNRPFCVPARTRLLVGLAATVSMLIRPRTLGSSRRGNPDSRVQDTQAGLALLISS